jgi:hypothetical protein
MSAESNEEYIIQGLDVVSRGIIEVQDQVQALAEMQAEAAVPPQIQVAMQSLKILSGSQKIITRAVVNRKPYSDSGDAEVLSETLNRYPRELKESEADLRDVCCQVIAGYLIQSLRPDPPNTIEEVRPDLS